MLKADYFRQRPFNSFILIALLMLFDNKVFIGKIKSNIEVEFDWR